MNAPRRKNHPDAVSGHPILDRSPRLRAAANRQGFDCLDRAWRGREALYRVRCRQGHEFLKSVGAMAQPGAGDCRECVLDQRTTRLHALAHDTGATCLEPRWLGSVAMHRFRCAHEHSWQRQGRKALEQTGCPHCGHERAQRHKWHAGGLQQLQQAAARHGGQCLAERDEGVEHVYSFRCAEGHVWGTQGSRVLAGKWCRRCAAQRRGRKRLHADGLARLLAVAASHDGECLSSTYESGPAFYRFRCSAGHEWETKG